MKVPSVSALIAAAIAVVVFGSYAYILAPSISFWDCGEYLATGATLGVPHPPGNPLYVMAAWVASKLFVFVKDPALRINLLTPLSLAATAVFLYLAALRILRALTVVDSRMSRLAIHTGAIVGALLAAFASTVAFCSVEAEVNTPLLLPLAICTWLAIKWGQSREPGRDRLLVWVALVSFLGIGIHVYSMIVMPPVLLYALIVDPSKRRDWRLLLTVALLGLVIYRVSWFLWIGPLVTAATLAFSRLRGSEGPRWRLSSRIALAALLGFSVHLYIPVRAAMNPALNMGHASTYQSFVDYLDRKQYGSEGMIERMFWRRGTWAHQLGIEGHMGFGGFYITQFFKLGPNDTQEPLFKAGMAVGLGKLAVYLVPTAVMLCGWWVLYRRQRALAVLLIALTLSTTILLVLYMNFADGTRPEKQDYVAWQRSGAQGQMPVVQREVRVRDYFWIGGFMYHGLGIGIAAGAALLALLASGRRWARVSVLPVTVVVLLLPAIPMASNLPANSRRGDMIPYNYAWNVLNSCERDAILFTCGDNDTYPLWAIQRVYGVRTDVSVVNLSLLNLGWYVRDCRDKSPEVPVRLSDTAIAALQPELNPFQEAVNFRIEKTGLVALFPSRQQRPFLQVQDKMVLHIVAANNWKRPVFFACYTDLLGLEPYLVQQGMVYKLTPSTGDPSTRYDMVRTEQLIDSVYRLDGFAGRRAQTDETSSQMSRFFPALVLEAAQERLRRAWDAGRELRGDGSLDSTMRRQARERVLEESRRGGELVARCEKLFGESTQSRVLREQFGELVRVQ